MKRRAALAAGAAFAAGLGHAQTTHTLRDRLPPEVLRNGVLRFVGDSHPPYRILSDDRKIRDGIDADLAQAMQPVLGIAIRHYVVNSLSGTLAGLESGRYDVAMGPGLATRDRLTRFDAVSWLVSRPSFVYPLQRPRRYRTVEDLCGRKVAYVAGSVSERVTDRINGLCDKAGKARAEHVPLVDTNMTLVATQAGRADVAAMTSTAGLHVVHETPDLFAVFNDPSDALGVDVLGLFVTKRSGLAPVLLAAMQAIFDNGEYRRIMTKWGVGAVSVQAPQMNLVGNR